MFRLCPAPPVGATAVSFADILGAAAFADWELLTAAVRSWDERLNVLRPAAVVCEFSPFLCLAAYGSSHRLLSVGHGFILPPTQLATFPRLYDGEPCFAEPELLANANRVCYARARQPLGTLPCLLAGTTHAVTGFPLLDPYRELRQGTAVGPPALECGLSSVTPSEDLFSYVLGEASSTTTLLRAWTASGLGGSVYVRRPTGEQRAIVASSRIRWLEAPEPIQQALDRAHIVLHHGSMLLTEEALAAGKPQIVAPIYLEHLFTARALARDGLARIVRPTARLEQIVTTMIAAANDATSKVAALAAARVIEKQYCDRNLPQRLLAMILAGDGA